MPPSLTPAALKKLVEKRNELFAQAVEEYVPVLQHLCHPHVTYLPRRLLLATPAFDNPVDLLQAASRDHIPVNPSQKSALSFFEQGTGGMIVPASLDRPSIDTVIEEITQQEWYNDQIVDRRVFDEKEGTIGMDHRWLCI
jgi:DEAD/DEAH box helicase domain-containing protein